MNRTSFSIRSKIKSLILSPLLLIFALSSILISCQVDSSSSGSSKKTKKCTLQISNVDVNQTMSRDVNPVVLASYFTDFKLTGKLDAQEEKKLCEAESLSSLQNLDKPIEVLPGQWIFKLSAKVSDYTYSGTCTKNIIYGENELSFILSPETTSGGHYYGGCEITVSWTGEATLVKGKLLSSDEASEVVPERALYSYTGGTLSSEGSVVFRKNFSSSTERLEAGIYKLVVEFYGGTSKDIYLNTYSEFIRIAPGLTAAESRSIDLNNVYTIDYYDFDELGNPVSMDPSAFATNAPIQFSRRSAFTLPEAKKPSLVFKGWYTNPFLSDDSHITEIVRGTSSSIKVYAKWETPYAALDGECFGDLTSLLGKLKSIFPAASSPVKLELFEKVTPADFGTDTETAGTIAYCINQELTAENASLELDMTGASQITSIADGLLSYRYMLKSVSFPETLTEIGERAFSNCENIESLVFPSSLEKIKTDAFKDCHGLTSVTFKDFSDDYRWKIGTKTYYKPSTEETSEALASNADYLKAHASDLWVRVKTTDCPVKIDKVLLKNALTDFSKVDSDIRFEKSASAPGSWFLSSVKYVDVAQFKVQVWMEGTTVYYYAEDYTDSGVKISFEDTVQAFESLSKLSYADLTGFDFSGATSFNKFFSNCNNLQSVDFGDIDTKEATDFSYFFENCESLEILDLSGFNTENVTDLSDMFINCKKLFSVDLSSFDTLNVTHFSEMFKGCEKLVSLDISTFDTTSITACASMFEGCKELVTVYAGDKTNFGRVNSALSSNMFADCDKLEGPLGTSKLIEGSVTSIMARYDLGQTEPGYFTPKNSLYVSGSDTSTEENGLKETPYHSLSAAVTKINMKNKPDQKWFIYFKSGALEDSLTVTDDDTSTNYVKASELYFMGLEEDLSKDTKVILHSSGQRNFIFDTPNPVYLTNLYFETSTSPGTLDGIKKVGAGDLLIDNCYFYHTFNSQGGALSVNNDSGSVYIQNTVFDTVVANNGAYGDDPQTGNGGAIYNEGTLYLRRVEFKNNKALGKGDAIYNASNAYIYLEGDMKISNTGRNDIYLSDDSGLILYDSLSSDSSILITPETYSEEKVILTADSGSASEVSDEYTKFNVSMNGTEFWYLSEEGKLKKQEGSVLFVAASTSSYHGLDSDSGADAHDGSVDLPYASIGYALQKLSASEPNNTVFLLTDLDLTGGMGVGTTNLKASVRGCKDCIPGASVNLYLNLTDPNNGTALYLQNGQDFVLKDLVFTQHDAVTTPNPYAAIYSNVGTKLLVENCTFTKIKAKSTTAMDIRGEVTLKNVSITENSAVHDTDPTWGNAVYLNQEAGSSSKPVLKLSGIVNISGNVKNTTDTSNVYIKKDNDSTSSSPSYCKLTFDNFDAKSSSIGVTLEEEFGKFTSGYGVSESNPASVFTSDQNYSCDASSDSSKEEVTVYPAENTIYIGDTGVNGRTGFSLEESLDSLNAAFTRIKQIETLTERIDGDWTIKVNSCVVGTSQLSGLRVKSLEISGVGDSTWDSLNGGSSDSTNAVGSVLNITQADYDIDVTIKKLSIFGGCASEGGGINLSSTCTRLILDEDCIIGKNIVDGDGNVTPPTASNFGNYASTCGGGVFVKPGATLIVTADAKVTGNYCNSHGGGIYVKGESANQSSVTLEDNATVLNNYASAGGGVFVSNSSSFTIGSDSKEHNCSLTKNTSNNGAAIYLSGGRVLMYSGSISENSAVRFGGALSTDGGRFIMTGGSIFNNSVSSGGAGGTSSAGGAIYFSEGALLSGAKLILGGTASIPRGNLIPAENRWSNGISLYARATSKCVIYISSNLKASAGYDDKNAFGVEFQPLDGTVEAAYSYYVGRPVLSPDEGTDSSVISMVSDYFEIAPYTTGIAPNTVTVNYGLSDAGKLIMTGPKVTVDFTISGDIDIEIKKNENDPDDVTLIASDGYTSYNWKAEPLITGGNAAGKQYTFKKSNLTKGIAYLITLTGTKNSMKYSSRIVIKVD